MLKTSSVLKKILVNLVSIKKSKGIKMRSPGSVYKKLKEVKFRHLINLYKIYLKRVPENCKYNYTYNSIDNNGQKFQIKLCLLHQDNLHIESHQLKGIIPHLVDVCACVEDCQNCNAFVCRFNKEDAKKIFEEELSNKSIREKKYPDICALEWVLERSSVGVFPITGIKAFFIKIKNLILRL
jgi:hypothetical protein